MFVQVELSWFTAVQTSSVTAQRAQTFALNAAGIRFQRRGFMCRRTKCHTRGCKAEGAASHPSRLSLTVV